MSNTADILVVWCGYIGTSSLSRRGDGVMGYRSRSTDRIANERMPFAEHYERTGKLALHSAIRRPL
jgi:hypothetical protein